MTANPTLAQRRAMTQEIDIRTASRVALPEHPTGEAWHPLTVKWWDEIWESGLPAQWTTADVQSAYRLAALDDAFWKSTSGPAKAKINSAIIAASRPLGLDPASRRALKWVPKAAAPVETPDETQKRQRDPRLVVVAPVPARRKAVAR